MRETFITIFSIRSDATVAISGASAHLKLEDFVQVELENAVGGTVSGANWPGAIIDVIIKDSDDARGVFRFNDETLRQTVVEMHDGGKSNQVSFKVRWRKDGC